MSVRIHLTLWCKHGNNLANSVFTMSYVLSRACETCHCFKAFSISNPCSYDFQMKNFRLSTQTSFSIGSCENSGVVRVSLWTLESSRYHSFGEFCNLFAILLLLWFILLLWPIGWIQIVIMHWCYMVYNKFLVVFEFQDISLIIIWEWISEAGLGRRNHQKKQQQQQQQRLILYPARMPIKQTRFVSVMLNISCSTIVSQAVTEFSFHKLCFCYLFFICLLMSKHFV